MSRQVFSKTFIFILLLLCSAFCNAQTATISEKQKVQEKVYLHLDNTGYCPGDVIWYKAYVVRADDLHPTDLSRLLYVELLSPRGYLIERQHVIINSRSEACGCFELSDSIYSGYYELRAYTLWQLNFNSYVRKYYSLREPNCFYDKQMQKNFYTDYQGLYSRIVPIYEHDDNTFTIMPEPTRRATKPKRGIKVSFFPEGGNLVQGLKSQIAFEVTDDYGRPLDITGKTESGITFKPEYEGRGTVDYTPGDNQEKVTFEYNGKDYSFKLPEAELAGCILDYNYKTGKMLVRSKGVSIASVSINCRGKNVFSQDIQTRNEYKLDVKKQHIPTGVNEFVVYDSLSNVLAYRLLFVNNHDIGQKLGVKLYNDSDKAEVSSKVKPYTKIDVSLKFPESFNGGASVSVRDKSREQASYDDGNILSDLLLSGDLKGFVAHPLYYFESNDDVHKRHLNTLLIIQGWRKYIIPKTIKYKPEKSLVFHGKVHKALDDYSIVDDNKPDIGFVEGPIYPFGATSRDIDEDFFDKIGKSLNVGNLGTVSREEDSNRAAMVDEPTGVDESQKEEPKESGNNKDDNRQSLNGKGKVSARKIINVESELIDGTDVMAGVTQTDAYGNFTIELPPYYGKRIMWVTAYNQKDSLKYSLFSSKNKTFGNAKAFPAYYVQHQLPYPVFCQPYSWYQTHVPDVVVNDSADVLANMPEAYGLDKVNVLPDVVVKTRRRRSLRDFDWSHPVITCDAYDLYNLATDRGTSFGMYEAGLFPGQAALGLFGDMGKADCIKVKAFIDDICYYNNYSGGDNGRIITIQLLQKMIQLKRLHSVKVFTDYNMRDGSNNDIDNSTEADVAFLFQSVPDENVRATSSARRYVFDGVNRPYRFYSPDYSKATPVKPNDYRRTLYWNPDVRPNKDGEFKASFFTGSRQCDLEVSACGLSENGNVYYEP